MTRNAIRILQITTLQKLQSGSSKTQPESRKNKLKERTSFLRCDHESLGLRIAPSVSTIAQVLRRGCSRDLQVICLSEVARRAERTKLPGRRESTFIVHVAKPTLLHFRTFFLKRRLNWFLVQGVSKVYSIHVFSLLLSYYSFANQ